MAKTPTWESAGSLPDVRRPIVRSVSHRLAGAPRALSFLAATLLGLLSALSSSADGQAFPKSRTAPNPRMQFEHLSIEDGLSHTRVNCLLQGQQGFMWFGTMTGLNKYDGSEFRIYTHDPKDTNSLSDNFVWSLYEDQGGVLWVGTWGGGLVRFDPADETFVRYRYDKKNPNSLSNDNVWSVCEDPKNKNVLWVATEKGSTSLIAPRRRLFDTRMIQRTRRAWALTVFRRSKPTPAGLCG